MENKLKQIGRRLMPKERVYVIMKDSIVKYAFYVIEHKEMGRYYTINIELITHNKISFDVLPEHFENIIRQLTTRAENSIKLIEQYNEKGKLYCAKILDEILALD